jgi:hypothetical protein
LKQLNILAAPSLQVSCIYSENPVLRSKMPKTPPLDNLAPLAKAGLPLLHVCGSLDPWLKDQTRMAEQGYREIGAKITIIVPAVNAGQHGIISTETHENIMVNQKFSSKNFAAEAAEK